MTDEAPADYGARNRWRALRQGLSTPDRTRVLKPPLFCIPYWTYSFIGFNCQSSNLLSIVDQALTP